MAWAGDWIRTATACWNTSQPLGGSDDHPTDRPGDEKKPGEEVPGGASYPMFQWGITVQHLAISQFLKWDDPPKS